MTSEVHPRPLWHRMVLGWTRSCTLRVDGKVETLLLLLLLDAVEVSGGRGSVSGPGKILSKVRENQ